MSKPESNKEIEDVVSSVRRLIAPEARARPVSRDLGKDRLILTPSLRVVAEQQASGPPLITLEAAERTRRVTVRAAKSDPARPAVLTENGAEIIVPQASRSAKPLRRLQSSLSEAALGAEEAEVVAADAPKSDTSPPAKDKARRSRKAASAPDANAAKPKRTRSKATGSGKPSVKVAEAMPKREADLPDPISDTFPEIAADAAETGARVLTDKDGNPVSLLTEDDLVLLLRRLIREELQGDLGEKITRNVRKLVRAEINRALTSQTLE